MYNMDSLPEHSIEYSYYVVQEVANIAHKSE